MIYSILRLLANGDTDTQIVQQGDLNGELQCWSLEGVQEHSAMLLFIMSDDNSSGHTFKNTDFVNNIFQDDDLLQRIRDTHRTIDIGDIYTIMESQYNVPPVLIPYILHEIKNSMGLF